MAGRITLTKHVLNTMPFYTMQTSRLPLRLCDEIDRICRSFIWGHATWERKIHLIGWDSLCKPVDCGGLGIRPTRMTNIAALAKMGWRLLMEQENLWAKVLLAKYGGHRKGLDIFYKSQTASNLWSGIVGAATIIQQGCKVSVENGLSTLFWNDTWLLDQPLQNYALSEINMVDKSRTVASYWNNSGWDLSVLHNLLPNEAIIALNACFLREDEDASDKFAWSNSSSGLFSIKSAYNWMRRELGDTNNKIWLEIWKSRVPQRCKVFT